MQSLQWKQIPATPGAEGLDQLVNQAQCRYQLPRVKEPVLCFSLEIVLHTAFPLCVFVGFQRALLSFCGDLWAHQHETAQKLPKLSNEKLVLQSSSCCCLWHSNYQSWRGCPSTATSCTETVLLNTCITMDMYYMHT